MAAPWKHLVPADLGHTERWAGRVAVRGIYTRDGDKETYILHRACLHPRTRTRRPSILRPYERWRLPDGTSSVEDDLFSGTLEPEKKFEPEFEAVLRHILQRGEDAFFGSCFGLEVEDATPEHRSSVQQYLVKAYWLMRPLGQLVGAAALALMEKPGVFAGLTLNAVRRCRSAEEQMKRDHLAQIDAPKKKRKHPFKVVNLGTKLAAADEAVGAALVVSCGMPVWTKDYGESRIELSDRALRRAQHLDDARGTRANDLENVDWETLHNNSPTIAEYWSTKQVPTSTRGRGDAMETMVGLSYACATGFRYLDAGDAIDFGGDVDRAEAIEAWSRAWGAFMAAGLGPLPYDGAAGMTDFLEGRPHAASSWETRVFIADPLDDEAAVRPTSRAARVLTARMRSTLAPRAGASGATS